MFALALVSLGILTLAYGDLAPIGQSLPTWIPWRETWIYGSALLALAAIKIKALIENDTDVKCQGVVVFERMNSGHWGP